jgi:phosphate-selective porin OprO/OprP
VLAGFEKSVAAEEQKDGLGPMRATFHLVSKYFLLSGAIFLASASPAAADESELKQILERLERLEKQNREQQSMLQQQQLTIARQQQILLKLLPAATSELQPASAATLQTQAVPAASSADPGNSVITEPSMEPAVAGQPGASGPIFNPSPNPGGGGIAAGSFPYALNTTNDRSATLAGWSDKDGFFLRSADDAFILRLTGQIQADLRTYEDREDSAEFDSFLIRRARLGVEGAVFKYWEYRLLPDFSNSQSNTVDVATPRILDAYVNAHYWDAFQVEAGKFKQPFSYEQLVQDRFIPTVERSLIDQLTPARDLGVMVHGEKLLGDRLDYAFSVFNGEINDDYDQNNGKDLAARIVLRPLNSEALPAYLRGVQLGIAYSWGIDSEPVTNTTPNVLRTPDQIAFLALSSGVRADGVRSRLSPEFVYFFEQFGFAAQYYYGEQHFLPSATAPVAVTVPESGFYVMSSYILTGEMRTTYSQPVVPFNNFDAAHPFVSPGAWELIARVSELRFGDDIFDTIRVGRHTYGPLANPALYSQGATEFDIGFNWFLNKYIRVELAYEHDWFLQPVTLGPGPAGRLTHDDSIFTRLQFAF